MCIWHVCVFVHVRLCATVPERKSENKLTCQFSPWVLFDMRSFLYCNISQASWPMSYQRCPGSTSLLAIEILGLQMSVTISSFTWVPGIWTQVLVLLLTETYSQPCRECLAWSSCICLSNITYDLMLLWQTKVSHGEGIVPQGSANALIRVWFIILLII